MMKIKERYFNGDISKGFIALYGSRSITRIAGGFFGLFLPIFLYEIFDGRFQYVASYFFLVNLLYALFLALSARFMDDFGFRKSLQLSVFFGALFYASLYFVDQNNWMIVLPISIVIIVIFRLLHWIPYHVDFAKFTDKKNRGKEVGLLDATTNVIGVITPFAGGVILGLFNFKALFVVAVLVYLISFIPLVTIPRTHEKFSWTYKKTWKEFFSKKRRETILTYLADGAESSVNGFVWPVFIYELLNGNYAEVGGVASIITASIIILQLLVGKFADERFSKQSFIKWGSLLYSLGWILKVFIATAFQIFVIDAYHKLMKIFLKIPFDALTYEIAADQGHFVDEFTVLHEMSIALGRVIACLLIIISVGFVGIHWLFIIAAVAAMLLNMIRAKRVVRPNWA